MGNKGERTSMRGGLGSREKNHGAMPPAVRQGLGKKGTEARRSAPPVKKEKKVNTSKPADRNRDRRDINTRKEALLREKNMRYDRGGFFGGPTQQSDVVAGALAIGIATLLAVGGGSARAQETRPVEQVSRTNTHVDTRFIPQPPIRTRTR